MPWLWRPPWRSVRLRVADLERRVAALEAGRPRIVSFRSASALPGRFDGYDRGEAVSMTSHRQGHAEVEGVGWHRFRR